MRLGRAGRRRTGAVNKAGGEEPAAGQTGLVRRGEAVSSPIGNREAGGIDQHGFRFGAAAGKDLDSGDGRQKTCHGIAFRR